PIAASSTGRAAGPAADTSRESARTTSAPAQDDHDPAPPASTGRRASADQSTPGGSPRAASPTDRSSAAAATIATRSSSSGATGSSRPTNAGGHRCPSSRYTRSDHRPADRAVQSRRTEGPRSAAAATTRATSAVRPVGRAPAGGRAGGYGHDPVPGTTARYGRAHRR